MTKPTELLPCPFCGAEAMIGETLDNAWYAMCSRDECLQILNHFGTRAEAVTAWNRRAPLSAAPAPVASGEVEREDPIVLPPDETDIRLLRDGIVPGCPCCAGTPTTFARFFERSGIYQSYVNCSRCYVQVFVNSRDREEARKVALERWSKRSLTTPARAVSREEVIRECAQVAADELENRRAEQKRDLFCNHLRGQINAADRIRANILALIGGE